MAFLDTSIDFKRSKEAAEWIEQELKEQEERHAKIVAEMDAISEQREQWYAEFFERLQSHGFNADGDTKVKIAAEDLPVRPDRAHKVVY